MNTIENTQGVLCSVHTETLVNLSSSPDTFGIVLVHYGPHTDLRTHLAGSLRWRSWPIRLRRCRYPSGTLRVGVGDSNAPTSFTQAFAALPCTQCQLDSLRSAVRSKHWYLTRGGLHPFSDRR